jgi:hypothetical protein
MAERAMLTEQSFAGFDIAFRATRILNDLKQVRLVGHSLEIEIRVRLEFGEEISPPDFIEVAGRLVIDDHHPPSDAII